METILAKKSGPQDNAIATDDEHHAILASDPTINAFPIDSTFGGANASFGTSTINSTFGSPTTGGFGSTSSFSAPATNGFGTQPLVGSLGSSAGFGAPAIGSTLSGATQMTSQNQAEMLKSSGGAIQEGAESTVKVDKDATDWINKKMRPMMGWIYMLTCTCDFVIFPVLWSVLQALSHGQVTNQWQPLTLQGAGLYHIAMGAVLGIAAYGRTKEKVAGVA